MSEFPLVLVPALGSDHRLWEPVIALLSDFVECIVIRGEGNTIEAMADSVLAQAQFAKIIELYMENLKQLHSVNWARKNSLRCFARSGQESDPKKCKIFSSFK